MDYNDFKGNKKGSYFGYFTVGIIGAVIGAFLVLVFAPARLFPKYDAPKTETQSQISNVKVSTDVSKAAAKVTPSVVGIVTTNIKQGSLFEQSKAIQGTGSGVIVDKAGYILTNNHVADASAKEIKVMTYDGKEHLGKVVWADPSLDLSIVKIDSGEYEAAALADSKNVTVGEPAIAIGNPLGLTFERTVTSGIVSALNRTLETEKGGFMEDLIQTDASINPGNSGGPLININGEVIGINTAKVSDAEGIGFAVPINIIKPILKSIVETGSFKAPYIGITGFDKELSKYFGYSMKTGVYIAKVDPNGPAAKSGVKQGDVILTVDGVSINTMMEFKEALFNKKIGEVVKLKLQEPSGATKEVEVKLAQ